jgi:hypothetical protein
VSREGGRNKAEIMERRNKSKNSTLEEEERGAGTFLRPLHIVSIVLGQRE